MTTLTVTRSSLLARVRRAGDAAGWQEFFDLYHPLLLEYVARFGVPDPDARDIVQDCFVTLLRVLPQFRYESARGRFRDWLRRMARHRMLDWRRRQGRRGERPLTDDLELLASAEDAWNAAHRQRVVEFVLQAVRLGAHPRTWTCFDQHLLQGRPAVDVARELGLTTTAVYVNASRTLTRVRAKCAEFEEDLADDR